MFHSPELTEGGINYEAVFNQLPPLPAEVTYDELVKLATPLFEVPPQDQWATVPSDEPEQPPVRVPFTQAEADAIVVAQQAHRELVRVAASISGIERDYRIDAASFPEAGDQLEDRTPAVWGIMIAAFIAHTVPRIQIGTAWQARETTQANMATIAQLPNHLEAHPPTS